MQLRVPGLDRDEARSLGEEVGRRVADGLSAQGRSRRLGALHLNVSIPAGTPRTDLAKHIALAILKGLA